MTTTGTLQDAQATTCQEYMSKTWPDVHEILLEGIEKMDTGDSTVCKLRDVLQRYILRNTNGFYRLMEVRRFLCTNAPLQLYD